MRLQEEVLIDVAWNGRLLVIDVTMCRSCSLKRLAMRGDDMCENAKYLHLGRFSICICVVVQERRWWHQQRVMP
jgi:hypothetical protein